MKAKHGSASIFSSADKVILEVTDGYFSVQEVILTPSQARRLAGSLVHHAARADVKQLQFKQRIKRAKAGR